MNCQAPPLLLDEARNEHCYDGDDYSSSHPLEHRDAAFDACDLVKPGYNDAVVDGNPKGESGHGEDGGEGGSGNLEGGSAKAAVRLQSLEHSVG